MIGHRRAGARVRPSSQRGEALERRGARLSARAGRWRRQRCDL